MRSIEIQTCHRHHGNQAYVEFLVSRDDTSYEASVWVFKNDEGKWELDTTTLYIEAVQRIPWSLFSQDVQYILRELPEYIRDKEGVSDSPSRATE